jgi:phage-related protein
MSLTRLASPTKEAAGLMEELGFNAFDSQGKMLPLNEVLGNLQKSTANLTDEQRMHAISTIFGAESMKSMLTLLEAGPETLQSFTGELQNAGGTAQTIADQQLNNLNGKLTILKSGLEAMAISIGTALMPVITWLVEQIQALVSWFNGLNPAVQTAIAVVAALAAGFALIMGPILLLVAAIPAITAGFGAIAGAIGIASSSLLAIIGVVTGVVAALALIGVGLVAAYNKVDWFKNAVDAAWSFIKNAWNKAVEFISDITKKVMSAIISFGGEQLAKFQALWQEHGSAIVSFVKNAFSNLVADIKIAMSLIETVFRTVWPIIEGLTKITWGILKMTIGSAIDIIVGLIDAGMSLLQGDWSGAWSAIKGIGEDIWHNIESFFRNIDLVEIGKDIIRGLVDGIGSMKRAVADKVKSIADAIPAGIKKLLGIHSPSRVLMELGEFTGEGFVNGIGSMVDDVKNVVADMSTAAVPAISKPDSYLRTVRPQSVNATNESYGDVYVSIDAKDVQELNGVVDFFKTVKHRARSHGEQLPNYMQVRL